MTDRSDRWSPTVVNTLRTGLLAEQTTSVLQIGRPGNSVPDELVEGLTGRLPPQQLLSPAGRVAPGERCRAFFRVPARPLGLGGLLLLGLLGLVVITVLRVARPLGFGGLVLLRLPGFVVLAVLRVARPLGFGGLVLLRLPGLSSCASLDLLSSQS